MKQVTIKNKFISLTVLDYGAIIQKLMVRDKNGEERNVVVGFENPNNYLDDTISLGACIGRYAGRISSGGFELNGNKYSIYTENGVHLHGGKAGFAKRCWNIDEIKDDKETYIKLSYLSPHMEEGYPGNISATVTYKLVANTLHIIHEATTDATTVLNMTNHSYFRFDDHDSINHYRMKLNCPLVLETHENLIPTGRTVSVQNSKYDFLHEKQIGKTRLDTPFVIDKNTDFTAKISSPISGITMKVDTNQPAVVVYTPLDFPAICFETQNYPDAPNNPHFPSSELRPGETYCNKSIFTFDLLP